MTGEPDERWLRPVVTHLVKGEGQLLTDSFNSAIQEWGMYTGKGLQ